MEGLLGFAKNIISGLLDDEQESIPVPKRKPRTPLIESIIIQESGGDPKAKSPKGAMGLMQIMPATAKKPGFGIKPLKDPMDPVENERFGTQYINALINRYGNTRDALIAYNWGMGNTDKWIRRGRDVRKLPLETRNYYTQILGRLQNGS